MKIPAFPPPAMPELVRMTPLPLIPSPRLRVTPLLPISPTMPSSKQSSLPARRVGEKNWRQDLHDGLGTTNPALDQDIVNLVHPVQDKNFGQDLQDLQDGRAESSASLHPVNLVHPVQLITYSDIEILEAVVDVMVFGLYFEPEMKASGCYINERVALLVTPFPESGTEADKISFVSSLADVCSGDEVIEHGLAESWNVEVVKTVLGEEE